MELTKEQIKNYIACGGTICPACGTEDIDAVESLSVNEGVGVQLVRCYGCNARWNDIYRLVNIVV